MKRRIISHSLLALLILLSSHADAQKKKADREKGNKPPFDVGSKTLAFSLGLGSDYNYNYYYDNTPVVLPTMGVIYDQGIIKAGPGIIGIGGYIGAQYAHYAYNASTATYRNYFIAARGTCHLSIFKDKNSKFDPYGGVTAGFRIFNYNDPGANFKAGNVYPASGIFVGVKYNFFQHFGVFSEIGYDISFIRFGVNGNF